jgi:hypothetical protein
MLRASCALAVVMLLSACSSSPAQEVIVGGSAAWSAPSTLSDCGGERPQVVFPTKEPRQASGPGAVIWSAAASCGGGTGARVATLTSLDLPREGEAPRSPDGSTLAPPMLTAAATPHGEIAIVGEPLGTSGGELIQGRAGGTFSSRSLRSGFSTPLALDTAWLGDLAIAAPPRGGARSGPLRLHIERWYAHAFNRNEAVGAQAGAVGALAVALDYRTDALVAWEQDGSLYARELPGRAIPRAIQRVAAVEGDLGLAALLSDDYRGILVWSEQRDGRTSVYFDQSSVGVRFGAPKLLERFVDPADAAPASLAPRLVRLSNESVMTAWEGASGGHWVVHTAAIDQHGIGAPSTIAAADGDALLCDLTAGPDSDALLLWSEPQAGAGAQPDAQRVAIFAARGIDAHPRRTIFGAPEEVAPPGPNVEATVAFDPANDRALAVWRQGAGALQYAVRAAG